MPIEVSDLKKIVDDLGQLEVTEDEFNEAAEMVKAIGGVSDSDKLQLYGLFKQATVGNVNTKRPWGVDFVGCAKWY